MYTLTYDEVKKAQALDNAASAKREAAKRQEDAKFLCVECHGPEGDHTSECINLTQ